MSKRIQRPGIIPALGNHEGRTRGLEMGLVDLSWGLFSASDFLVGTGLVTVEYDTWTTNADETFDFDVGTPDEARILEEGTYLFFQSGDIQNGGGGVAADWAKMNTTHTADASASLPLGIFTPFHGSPAVQGALTAAGLTWFPHLIEMRVYNDDGTVFPAVAQVTMDLDFVPGNNVVSTLIVKISNPT